MTPWCSSSASRLSSPWLIMIHCLLDKVLLNLMVWPHSQDKLGTSRNHVHCWQSNLSVEINYPATLPASTIIILFSEMLSFSHTHTRKIKIVKGKYWTFKNVLFVEMKISKVITVIIPWQLGRHVCQIINIWKFSFQQIKYSWRFHIFLHKILFFQKKKKIWKFQHFWK
jgi:hypothetical protein